MAATVTEAPPQTAELSTPAAKVHHRPAVQGLTTVYLVGDLADGRFQHLRLAVQSLADALPKNFCARIVQLTPMEWSLYVSHVRMMGLEESSGVYAAYTHSLTPRKLPSSDARGDVTIQQHIFDYRHPLPADVKPNAPTVNDICHALVPTGAKRLGLAAEAMQYLEKTFGYEDSHASQAHAEIARNTWSQWMARSPNSYAKMNITISGKTIGSLTFELFDSICPKTCENFKQLLVGTSRNWKGDLAAYRGTKFHRLVKNGWIQGGDTSNTNGAGGDSVFGPTFEDESFAVPHLHRGILSMANNGPHTNGSQFLITLRGMPSLDKNYVAFGRVVEGADVLKAMESVETMYPERPVVEIAIGDCEVLSKNSN